ncbi:CPBP family intramembrane glutamic endopeptidase [Pseudooceanicola sp. C21-150M6]|uniref:CPBP family intramembrane glutamic endopeptidase n=1 Tax=Pseudooceanicola sp. C21-150M6 TaxID=3434355 RepID=UPI003D7FA4C7
MRWPAAYAPFARLIAPAGASPSVFPALAVFIVIELLYGVSLDWRDALVGWIWPSRLPDLLARVTIWSILVDLFSFALLGGLVLAVVRRGYNRSVVTLTGPFKPMLREIPRAALAALALFATVEMIMPWWSPEQTEMQPLDRWLLILPVSLAALLVQVGAEELLYRGYLQQQIASRFPHPLIWMILPNIAFAAAHWFNETDAIWALAYVIWAFAFGVLASDLTARSGHLGPAVGFHLANNIYAFLFIGEAGMPDGALALFQTAPFPHSSEVTADAAFWVGLSVDILVLVLAWLAVRLAIRR